MSASEAPRALLVAASLAVSTWLLPGCAVIGVAGAATGAVITVAGAVVATGVTVTGKVIEKTVDIVTPGRATATAP